MPLYNLSLYLYIIFISLIFTYIPSFLPTSLEQFLNAIWNAVSQAVVPILPQTKCDLQL